MKGTPQQHRATPRRRLRQLIALVAIASVAAVVLAACGSSSNSKSNTATNAASTTTGARGSNRFASVRACLQKQGIKLPSRRPGGQRQGGPPGAGRGGFKLPEGVSRTQLQEALKKCGGGFRGGRRPGFSRASARAALTKYASCMRENGVNLPAPNTSGNGPIFDTKGIDRSSTTFTNAQKACQSDLKGAFGAGRPPGAGAGGAPPGGEGGPPQGGEGGSPGADGGPPSGGEAPGT